MLTGKQVRVRFARDRIVPYFLDADDPALLEQATRMLELFRGQEGRTRGELDEDQREEFGDDPGQLLQQGLAKLLEDRCEFETVSGLPPEELRSTIFRAAAEQRRLGDSFDRASILESVANATQQTVDAIDQGLFADLKSEQRLITFKDISADHLLQRYNVALVQAVLLRATRVRVVLRGEPPQRFRQLLRRLKFHRLVCEFERYGGDAQRLTIDGPLSLFTATQKYGLQLALFFPSLLRCRDFDLEADVRWGPQRRDKKLRVTSEDGLVSNEADSGVYVPPELGMFAELFRKRITDWQLLDEPDIYPLGTGHWVPDFRLVHQATGREVLLEVLGFWRRGSAEKHLARLRQFVQKPFLLAVSDQLHIDEADLESLPAGIHRFRNMPLPEEIARLALAAVES